MLTRAGWLTLGAGLPLLYVAAAGGNNLLYLLVAVWLSLWLVQLVAGHWNLRGLEAARRLPPELFATRRGRGRLVLRNPRERGPAVAVTVEEGHEGEASAVFSSVDAGEECELGAVWRFDERGLAHLGQIRLTSSHPFGLVLHERLLPVYGSVVVYPRLRLQGPRNTGTPRGRRHEDPRREGHTGDFFGLRAYQTGDPLRLIHWKTSARTRQPMVVQRSAVVGEEVHVVVEDVHGAAWERALERAAGVVVEALAAGARVWLELPGEPRLGPVAGRDGRYVALDRLARAPRR